MPTVSVVIPVFNRQDALTRAIGSVLTQSYDDYELIVVDDGSCEPLDAAKQPNLRIVRHQTNRGAAAARNTGVGAAKGRYVAFLNSDDTWHRDKLARQIAFMEADQNCQASCSGFALIRDGTVLDRRLPPAVSDLDEILWGCRVSPGTTLVIQRSLYDFVGPMDETLGRLEDWDWMLKVAQHAPFMGLREVLADVRHDRYAHVNEARFVAAANRMTNYAKTGRYALTRGQHRVLLSAIQYELAANYYRKQRTGLALVALFKSFAYCPWKKPEHLRAALNAVGADVMRMFRREPA